MPTASLKKEVKALIDKETNVRKLEVAYTLLAEGIGGVKEPVAPYTSARRGKKGETQEIQKVQGMKNAVAISEREFAEGKGIPLDRFEKEVDAMLAEVYTWNGEIEPLIPTPPR